MACLASHAWNGENETSRLLSQARGGGGTGRRRPSGLRLERGGERAAAALWRLGSPAQQMHLETRVRTPTFPATSDTIRLPDCRWNDPEPAEGPRSHDSGYSGFALIMMRLFRSLIALSRQTLVRGRPACLRGCRAGGWGWGIC